jgi:serine/threonine protein kinase
VYRARDVQTGRLVTVRVIQESDPALLGRIEATLRHLPLHPNIITIYRTFHAGHDQLGLVEDVVDGPVTNRWRRTRSATTIERALAIGVKAASAVETAHRAGVLHLDLKPSNVLLSRYGEPVVAGFGLAELYRHDHCRATPGSKGVASLSFVAPELSHDGEASAASDVYSLAATVWRLITDMPAPTSTQAAIPAETGIPPDLVTVLARALSSSPSLRQGSAAELALDLSHVAAAQRWTLTPLLVPPVISHSAGSGKSLSAANVARNATLWASAGALSNLSAAAASSLSGVVIPTASFANAAQAIAEIARRLEPKIRAALRDIESSDLSGLTSSAAALNAATADDVLVTQLWSQVLAGERLADASDRARLPVEEMLAAIETWSDDQPAGAISPTMSLTDAEEEELRAAGSLRRELPPLKERASWRSLVQRVNLASTGLTVGGAAERLGVSEGRIRQRLSARTLFGIKSSSGWRLPSFQFDEHGEVRGLGRVLPALPPDVDPLVVVRFLTGAHVDLELDGEQASPIEWLSAGGEIETVVALASDLHRLP